MTWWLGGLVEDKLRVEFRNFSNMLIGTCSTQVRPLGMLKLDSKIQNQNRCNVD